MTDFRKLAFVGLVGLGFASFACSSSNSSSGTGGTTGSTGGTGGTTSHTGGTTGTGTGGTTLTGTGGSSQGGAAGATLGCAASDPPASAEIATFSSADGGIAPMFGTFPYGDNPQPTFTIEGGMVNVTDTVQIDTKNHYQGFGIYFNGNAAGTDCLDAHTYTGVEFDLSGSLTGAGCTMQFSINDSEHANPAASSPPDPKAGGMSTSYAPQLQITSAQLTSTATPIMVPFTEPTGGSPSSGVDPTKLTGVQWQLSVPVASDGGATECVWNFNISNLKFY
jgi:hypothetical protein